MADPPPTENTPPAAPPGPPPPPPNSAAAAWAKDPYAVAVVVAQGVQPTPGTPQADEHNVVTIFVPADMTTLQMGAASAGPSPNVPAISGFRMSTSTHAHLTAQSPLTTISLGKAGGEGMGGVAGLSIYTAAQKDERVDAAVTETYNTTKTEHVVGALVENYDSTKNETVGGKLVEHIKGEATYNHDEKLTITSKERQETITGDWNATITKELKWDVGGPSEITGKGDTCWLWRGSKKESAFGATIGFFGGFKNEITVGLMTDTKVGGILETTVAAKIEINKGPRYVASMVVEKGKRKIHLENETLAKKEAELAKEEIKTKMEKGTLKLDDIATFIIK